MHDDTTLLLGLDGVEVDRVELDPDGCRVVHLATAEDVSVVCPLCRAPSSSPMGWATTRPRDLPGPSPARLVGESVAGAAASAAVHGCRSPSRSRSCRRGHG